MQKLKDFAKLLRNVIFLFSYYIFFLFFCNFDVDSDKGWVAGRLHHVTVSAKSEESRNMVKITTKGRHSKTGVETEQETNSGSEGSLQ